MDSIEKILGFSGKIQIADIGAAVITKEAPYKNLLEQGLAHVHAFEADQRHTQSIKAAYGDSATIHQDIVGCGERRTLFVSKGARSGMTSLFRPSRRRLAFFNGFEEFGTIIEEIEVNTSRLDDIPDLPDIEFLKMDVQGAELDVLRFGQERLSKCAAVQLEVSFVPLYEGQPAFGEVDTHLRSMGFIPHAMPELKQWSIAPMVRGGDIGLPFNQLLEADMVYMRNPIEHESLSDEVLKCLAIIAHYVYSSVDLAVHILRVLEKRQSVQAGSQNRYLEWLNTAHQVRSSRS